jgi:hypothetical protein
MHLHHPAHVAKLGVLLGTLMALLLGTVVARWRGV